MPGLNLLCQAGLMQPCSDTPSSPSPRLNFLSLILCKFGISVDEMEMGDASDRKKIISIVSDYLNRHSLVAKLCSVQKTVAKLFIWLPARFPFSEIACVQFATFK